MFAIYTPNGRTFSGPLEDLRRIEKPQAAHATRKHQDIDDMLSFGQKGYSVAPKAIDAYREAIHKPQSKEPISHAYQFMTTPVHVLSGDSTLAFAVEQFKQKSFQDFPIINSRHELIGRLSRQQVYSHLIKRDTNDGGDDKNKTIAELFLTDDSKVYAAEPVSDIRRVAGLLIEQTLHTIPILENNGKIVGIISRTDIIKAVMTDPPLSLWC